MDTNLLSVEELVTWCFGVIKVITETLGISVPVCRLQAVCIDLRATCSRLEKIKNKFCHYWGQCALCSGHCGYYWGQYHAELAPRPSDARTTLSECGNSHFCFLFLILIQSFCAKVALAVSGFLVDFIFYWSVTSKVLESEKGKRPQIELSYCQSRLGVILSPGATVNILIELSLVSWEVIE